MTTFYAKGKVVGTYTRQTMPNGFVDTEACYGGYCYTEVMSPMSAKKLHLHSYRKNRTFL